MHGQKPAVDAGQIPGWRMWCEAEKKILEPLDNAWSMTSFVAGILTYMEAVLVLGFRRRSASGASLNI